MFDETEIICEIIWRFLFYIVSDIETIFLRNWDNLVKITWVHNLTSTKLSVNEDLLVFKRISEKLAIFSAIKRYLQWLNFKSYVDMDKVSL